MTTSDELKKQLAGKRLWATTDKTESFTDHTYRDGLNLSPSFCILFGVNDLAMNPNRCWIREVTLCDDSEINNNATGYNGEIFKTNKAILHQRRPLTRKIINEIFGVTVARKFFEKYSNYGNVLYSIEDPTIEQIKKAIRDDKHNIRHISSYSYDLIELYKYALEIHSDALKYMDDCTTEIQLQLIQSGYVMSFIKIMSPTPDDTRLLYKNHGPAIIYYIINPPEDVQIDMMKKDPMSIWYIINPTPTVISMATGNTVWSKPECYYSPVFSFKLFFEEYHDLKYEQFCLEVKNCAAYVSSGCIFAQLLGETDKINADLTVVIKDDSTKFKQYLLSNNYNLVDIGLAYDQVTNLSQTRQIFGGKSVQRTKLIVVVTVQCDPLAFIMNASVIDCYRIAFDGEGLWTWTKFNGQDITRVCISECAFTLLELTEKQSGQFAESIINNLSDNMTPHKDAIESRNNVKLINMDEFKSRAKAALKRVKKEVFQTTTPIIDY